MEHQTLETRTDDIGQTQSVATYSIIVFPGNTLPEEYQNVVLARWLRTLRFGNEYFKLIDKNVYFTTYNEYIKSILVRPTVSIKLAVLTEDPDVVLGWSVSEGKTLHYVHVQKDQRSQGIGLSLIPTDTDTFTHLTKAGALLWTSKFPAAIFNPFK